MRTAVTGAFGYTGKYIARRLLQAGHEVITLTGHPNKPHPLNAKIEAYPFNFDRPEALAQSLRGIDTLYNTYWIRFAHGDMTFERAVENTRTLFAAAHTAGVRRVVHISITNPSLDSPLPYFRGKAQLEKALQNSELSHAILRPTVIFSKEDILINNIAYLLRRLPIFALPGSGEYRLQPIFIEDVAALALEVGGQNENLTMDAVGPEIYTYNQLVKRIRHEVGGRSRLIHLPPKIVLILSRLIGALLRDVILTPDEVRGLMANLLISSQAPTGQTRFSEWLHAHANSLGRKYASELERHYRQ